ncbi:MAG: flagellar hook-basal body complex protein FliE [bacterium]|nr:flagellar hook-basal body complex protein FliE [bacterium]
MQVDLNSLLPKPISSEAKPIKKERSDSSALIGTFSEVLKGALTDVNDLANEADLLSQKLVTGEIDNIHGVMIAVSKAEVALDLTNQIRNRVIRAYEEIMRMR